MSAESAVYRRSHSSSWQQVRTGLPEEKGLLTFVLTTNPANQESFTRGQQQRHFPSTDAVCAGKKRLMHWPDNFQMGRVNALAVVEE